MRTRTYGFTLIEIVVVLLIMGVVMGIAIPALQYRKPQYVRKEFANNLATLLNLGLQQTLAEQRPYVIYFDVPKRLMSLRRISDKKDPRGDPIFEPVALEYVATEYGWQENLVIKQLFVEGTDMMRRPGVKTEEMWFYLVPEGLVQSTILNITDSDEQDERGIDMQFSLTINPFTAQVIMHDTFQKP